MLTSFEGEGLSFVLHNVEQLKIHDAVDNDHVLLRTAD